MWFNSGQRVLVLGLAKSGVGKLAKQLALSADAAFMPGAIKLGAVPGDDYTDTIKKIADYKADKRGFVAQGVVYPQHFDHFGGALGELCSSFDAVLWVHRDPRDRLISHQLFRWARVPKIKVAKGRVNEWHDDYKRFAERLDSKQQAPSTVPMLTLMAKDSNDHSYGKALASERLMYSNMPAIIEQLNATDKFAEVNVDTMFGRPLDAMVTELGLTPVNSCQLEPFEANSWPHWLTPADVDALKPLFNDYCEHCGFDTSWQLSDPQVIDAKLSTQYVQRVFAGANKRLAQRVGATVKQ